MPDMRAYSLHVDLSLHILHDLLLSRHVQRRSDSPVRRHGYLRIRIRRILHRSGVGKIERQDRAQAGPHRRLGRDCAQHDTIRVR